jgi:hypothetical protein
MGPKSGRLPAGCAAPLKVFRVSTDEITKPRVLFVSEASVSASPQIVYTKGMRRGLMCGRQSGVAVLS